MGYWPAKLVCFLNIVLQVGYNVISCIIAGQILSAVSGGSLSIVVGIIITALISWLVAVFGMAVFQTYERSATECIVIFLISKMLTVSRWAGIPQVIMLLILAGLAGKHFDTSSQSTGGSAAVTSGRLSFFSLSLSAPVGWGAAGSDFYVYVSPTSASSHTIHLLQMSNSSLWKRIRYS